MVEYYIVNSVEDKYIYSILIYNVYNISGTVGRLPHFPHQRPWPGGRGPDTAGPTARLASQVLQRGVEPR